MHQIKAIHILFPIICPLKKPIRYYWFIVKSKQVDAEEMGNMT